MKPYIRGVLLVVSFLLAGICFLAPPKLLQAFDSQEESPGYAPGQFVIKFKSEGPHALKGSAVDIIKRGKNFKDAFEDQSEDIDALNEKFKIKNARSLFNNTKNHSNHHSLRAPKEHATPDLRNTYVFEFDEEGDSKGKRDLNVILDQYRKDPHVEYAHPNYSMEPQFSPNDPYYYSAGYWGQSYDDLWGLKRIEADLVWDLTQGEGVVVAINDSGLDHNHPDIAENVWTNPNDPLGDIEDSCNRVADPSIALADDDCNGYADDIHGWNFINESNDTLDDYGHGTFIAGVIGAVGNNGIGIIGVAPKVKIMPLKAFNSNGYASSSDAAEAILYAAMNGADIINNSWVCTVPHCPKIEVIEDAVRTAYGLGVINVMAAANNNDDARLYSPQNMKETFTVSSTDWNDARIDSNWGILDVDFAAPGGNYNILSLGPGGTYSRGGGTSSAAAFASGAAALLLALHPQFSIENIRQAMRVSAVDLGEAGLDSYYGAGRINVSKALAVSFVPDLDISSPLLGTAFYLQDGSSIPIKGTAAGMVFQSYNLSLRPYHETGPWQTIVPESFAPVLNATLGDWDLSPMTLDKSYVLKLTVTSAEGLKYETATLAHVDSRKPIQVTTASGAQWCPDVFENHVIFSNSFTPSGVFHYDADEKTAPEFLTSASGSLFHCPSISGDRIAFLKGNYDIYVRTLSTGAEQLIHHSAVILLNPPIISGDKVVWQDKRNGNYDIFLYDLTTNTQQQLTSSTAWQEYPDISGNWVVWVDSSSIKLYDLTTKSERLLASGATWPTISGNRVAYSKSFGGGYLEVCVYDLTTNTEQRITNDIYDDWKPTISGDLVVWQKRIVGDDWDLYGYNLATNKAGRIVTGVEDQKNQSVWGGRVAWTHFRKDVNYDIYALELGSPVLDPIGNKVVKEGETLNFTVTATDPEDDYLSFSTGALPAGATFDAETQYFSWRPDSQQIGEFSIKFVVRDASFLSDSETITVTVKAKTAPLLAPIGNKTITAGQTLSFQATATDADGDPLTFSAAPLPAGATFSETTGQFVWQPTDSQSGTYTMTFTVLDDNALSDSETITITVQKPETAPVLAPIGNKTIMTGQTLSFQVTATDADGDPLTFSAMPLPAGATFSATTGQFVWKPTSRQTGTYPVTFTVSDDNSLSDSETITITVTKATCCDVAGGGKSGGGKK